MANSRSARKRIRVTATKTLRNKMIKTRVKNAIKRVISAANAKDAETANAAYVSATREIDKAATKGVYHKNNASRKKSRLAKLVNKNA